jgi:hypothetical protein
MSDEPHVAIAVENKSEGMPMWAKVASTLGLGAVIGYLGFNHFMGADNDNREFVQSELIDALKENTSASTAMKESSGRVENVLGKVEDELDDFSKATEEQGRRIDRLLENQWKQMSEPTSP